MSGIWSGRVNRDQLEELAALVDAASEQDIGVIYASVSKYRDRLTYYIQLTDDTRTILSGDFLDCAHKLAGVVAARAVAAWNASADPHVGTCIDCGKTFPTWVRTDRYCHECQYDAERAAETASQALDPSQGRGGDGERGEGGRAA